MRKKGKKLIYEVANRQSEYDIFSPDNKKAET